ncbi:GatB/YqeY domain-containing protein [Chloroflexota bacterium]
MRLGPNDLGKVMGRLMPQVRGEAEGAEVRQVVADLLGG